MSHERCLQMKGEQGERGCVFASFLCVFLLADDFAGGTVRVGLAERLTAMSGQAC